MRVGVLFALTLCLLGVTRCSEQKGSITTASILDGNLVAAPAGGSVTTLWVDGQRSQIIRDQYGVPHIFARTNRGVFVADGYAVAQDRLWQLETYRRTGRGTLAEILGFAYVPADQFARLLGYRESELDDQFSALTEEEQEIFNAYVEGINRYITEVVAPDPANRLPVEFFALQIGVPSLYDVRDLLSFLVVVVRQFGEIGGRELTNAAFLADLVDRYGETGGYGIFNDARWAAPTGIRAVGIARSARQAGQLRVGGRFSQERQWAADALWRPSDGL